MFQIIYICFLFIFGFNLCLCFEDAWQAYQSDLRNANREELIITGVTTDENFKLDGNVKKWTSLSIGPTCYSVGLMDTGLALLFTNLNSTETGFDIKSKVVELDKQPIDAILLEHKRFGEIEVILIVAFHDDLKLKWYKIRGTELENFWTWNLTKPTIHINAFSAENKLGLLLARDYNKNSTTVDLYQYQIRHVPNYWFWHAIEVSYPISSSAFNKFEYDSYLSLPEKSLNLVTILKHEENHFVPYGTIQSTNVESVVAFEIGFQSFLAIDGSSAGIYQFTRRGLEREDIINSNLHGMEYWLPVPVKTYRDDAVLFAQRALNYTSHQSYMIEVITYNGAKFEEHEDIPCRHYGEQIEWLTCLSDKNGITSSSYLAAGDKLGLILPRASNVSFLFMVDFSIKQIPNPLELELKMLFKQKENLQKMIETQNEAYEELETIHKTSQVTDGGNKILRSQQRANENPSLNQELRAISDEIEKAKKEVESIEMEKRLFDVVTINGPVEIEDGKFKNVEIDLIGGESATELLEDIVRKDSIGKITGDKIFNKIDVRDITFDKVNGIEASQIVFKNDSKLTGNITVHDTAQIENIDVITGQVNDIKLADIVDMGSAYNGTLNFEKLKVLHTFEGDIVNKRQLHYNEIDVPKTTTILGLNQSLDTVTIPENLTVTTINGDDLDAIIKQLCLINMKCYIPNDLKINGHIRANNGSVTYLNGLKFPEEYIFKESTHSSTTITGRKTFSNSLTARDIMSRGRIDGVDIKKLITLSTDQLNIPGKVTLKDIEVADQLNVEGQILGDHTDMFLPNPTLLHVKNIKANVNFKRLEVDGNIIIEDNWNKDNFEKILKDLVYKDDTEADILAQKDFPKGFTVVGNLNISSNSINKVNLDSLVTKDTDQILNITILNGDVVINNLGIGGKFDRENITQLDQELVKLTGEQYISSTLIFKEYIDVENFVITETLNNVKPEEYLYTDGDEKVDAKLRFRDIEVESIIVEGNFSGNIDKFNLKDFNDRYLSYSKDQTIEKHYHIVHSTIDNLKAERINGEDFDDVFSNEKFSEKLKEMLNSGQLKVQDLYVTGSLQVKSVNDKAEEDWLPRDNLKDPDGKYKKDLFIEGNIFFDTLEIDKLSDVKWNWFNNQLVPKDEVNLVMLGAPFKNFLGGIRVDKLIEARKVNGIPIQDILTKQGKQRVRGPITIKGDVVFKESVNITENIDEVAVGEILNHLEVEDGTYSIKDDMVFLRLPHIYILEVKGYVNNKNITEYLSHVVHLDEDTTFDEEIVFEYPVEISGNLAIEQGINGIDWSDVASQIVLTTHDAEIQGQVTFLQSVVVRNHLTIEGKLSTDTLYGIDLEEWKNNAVFLDRGRAKGTYGFDKVVIKDILDIKYLNEMDVNSIIPLRSDQTLDYLEFDDVIATKDISVLGLVNGYQNLSNEFEVTVMTDIDQQIHSNIVFNDVILVRKDLSTDLINGKEVSKIVTTNTDQTLTSVFDFKSQCKMESDLHVHGLVDGINLTVWKNRNIKISSQKVQEVFDDWDVNNLTFNGDVRGRALISDLNLTSVMEEVIARKNYKYGVEYAIIEDYKNMCIDVSYLYDAMKKQIYKFKYFEEFQTLAFNNQVQFVHHFQYKDKHYLLVNDNKCSSELLVFKNTKFEHLTTVETGHISQVITVQGNTSIFLVTRDVNLRKKCVVEGTNVWKFDGEILEIYYNIEEQGLLQESVIPFTFYGMSKQGVIEFKIIYNIPRRYRKWKIFDDNAAFMPRDLKTGLSLRTGRKIISLDQEDPLVDEYSPYTDSILIGTTSELMNYFVPGRNGGDLVVTKVGMKSTRRNLLAVATHEETSVRGRLDFIKIYSDVFKGEIFHKVPAYKPSSLLSVEFDQGETLLVFLENKRTLQVYEYKGIEGFKLRSSAKIEGSKLFLMNLPIKPYINPRKTIGIVHNNKISIIQAIMLGNKIKDGLKCGL